MKKIILFLIIIIIAYFVFCWVAGGDSSFWPIWLKFGWLMFSCILGGKIWGDD